MDKRGSALVNVLVVTTVLMILGTLILQIVSADSKFASADFFRADALQLAEGGVDYAIDQIVLAEEEGITGVQNYEPRDNVSVKIDSLGNKEYRITSTAVVNNSTRTLEVELTHNPFAGPFEYAVFVGGDYTITDTIDLKNLSEVNRPVHIVMEHVVLSHVIFNSPIIIDARTAELGPNVVFNAGVTFVDCEVTNNGYTVFPLGSEIFVEAGYFDDLVFPYVDIDFFSYHPDYIQWKKGVIEPWGENGEIHIEELKSRNYFSDTVIVTWSGNSSYPSPLEDDTLVIVSKGDIVMQGNSDINHESYKMILIAGGDIVGPKEDVVKNIQVPLYMYAGNDIKCGNNLSQLRSTIALGHLELGSGMSSFEDFPTEIPGLTEAWSSRVTITQWKN